MKEHEDYLTITQSVTLSLQPVSVCEMDVSVTHYILLLFFEISKLSEVMCVESPENARKGDDIETTHILYLRRSGPDVSVCFLQRCGCVMQLVTSQTSLK